jgi:hypothetical protein
MTLRQRTSSFSSSCEEQYSLLKKSRFYLLTTSARYAMLAVWKDAYGTRQRAQGPEKMYDVCYGASVQNVQGRLYSSNWNFELVVL